MRSVKITYDGNENRKIKCKKKVSEMVFVESEYWLADDIIEMCDERKRMWWLKCLTTDEFVKWPYKVPGNKKLSVDIGLVEDKLEFKAGCGDSSITPTPNPKTGRARYGTQSVYFYIQDGNAAYVKRKDELPYQGIKDVRGVADGSVKTPVLNISSEGAKTSIGYEAHLNKIVDYVKPAPNTTQHMSNMYAYYGGLEYPVDSTINASGNVEYIINVECRDCAIPQRIIISAKR